MNDDSSNTAAAAGFDLGKVIDIAKAVVTNPVGFYRTMPVSGGYAEPAIFVAVMGFIMGAIVAVFSMLGLGGPGGAATGFVALILLPIFAVIGSFIGGLVMFVVWKLMGSDKNFETAYRCVAFASGIYPITALLSAIPYIGTIVSTVWGLYLMFAASTEVHNIARQTAAIVLAVLGAILLFTQVGGEIAARKMEAKFEDSGASIEDFGKSMEKWGEAMENAGEDGEEMSPEEAGRAMGEFFKGMSEAVEGADGAKE